MKVEELINEITNIRSVKGLFKMYIRQGLEENPDGLFRELYEQISLNYNDSVELMGEKFVHLVLEYVEASGVFNIPVKKFVQSK